MDCLEDHFGFIRPTIQLKFFLSRFMFNLIEPCDTSEVIKASFVTEGDDQCFPLSREHPSILKLDIPHIHGKIEGIPNDEEFIGRDILSSDICVNFCHLSIPFLEFSGVKGVYICINRDSGPISLQFSFVLLSGLRIPKNVSFSQPTHDLEWHFVPIKLVDVVLCEIDGKGTDSGPISLQFSFVLLSGLRIPKNVSFSQPTHDLEWHFVPIKLVDVVLCEIDGKGTWENPSSLNTSVNSMVFVQELSSEESMPLKSMEDARTQSIMPTSEISQDKPSFKRPQFIKMGQKDSVPIRRDEPCVLSLDVPNITSKNAYVCKQLDCFDKSAEAKAMMLGERYGVVLSHIFVPFTAPSRVRGIYICVDKDWGPKEIHCIVTQGDSTVSSRRYLFVSRPACMFEWYLLNINLPKVVSIELEVKGMWGSETTKSSCVQSLIFIKKLPREVTLKKDRELFVAKTSCFDVSEVNVGDMDFLNVSLTDPNIVIPKMDGIRSQDCTYNRESDLFDTTSQAKLLLSGDQCAKFTHISVPFHGPSFIKGAYLSPSMLKPCSTLLFTFERTKSAGKTIFQKYNFVKPTQFGHWYYFRIGLHDVTRCDIEAIPSNPDKPQFNRVIGLFSLIFVRDSPKWPRTPRVFADEFDDDHPEEEYEEEEDSYYEEEDEEPEEEEEEEEERKKGKGRKDEEEEENTDKVDDWEESEEVDVEEVDEVQLIESPDNSEMDNGDEAPYPFPTRSFRPKDKSDQCSDADVSVHREHEDSGASSSMIIKTRTDITVRGVVDRGIFGDIFLVDVKHCKGIPNPCVLKRILKVGEEDVIRECTDVFTSHFELYMNPICGNRVQRPLYILDLLDSKYQGTFGFIMEHCIGGDVRSFANTWCVSCSSDSKKTELVNPVRICSLCVGMIECLDEVFMAKPTLVHNDIRPGAFLVRFDPGSKKGTIVLSDLGFVKIQDFIDDSISCETFATTDETHDGKDSRGLTDSLPLDFFRAPDTQRGTTSSQITDAYSLGISILALFLDHSSSKTLDSLHAGKISICLVKNQLFRSLLLIDKGKFRRVFSCFDQVFTGLTQSDPEKRLSVHQACAKVQAIKHLLPKIGDGWKCPSIDECLIDGRIHDFAL
ncbi:hypothetical protein ADUPG1_013388 [Aduncisulcus paluster]|uniref:Protein kinase domain-containing protein n=1 Tax=Aduncisulcus paluster TaxID=2918883 RepID=A0ABQ5K4T7_9EUKA|nr:hypothetical protein ADUPG1_013388 [Aduncisulcus paluster]